ncbi:MAG: InlB B-repeat-containing protein [Kiritimatiellae bacterium]|nr:InlB B-repeat-containing protein [Kiritimatiellia bacterium]
MKTIVKMSKYWIFGLLIGCTTLMSARADTNTTYTVSFESYEVRGTTYSVQPITGLHSGDALTKLNPSTLHPWLLGWADAAGTKYYDENGVALLSFTGEADLTLHALIDAPYFVHQVTFADYVVGGKTNSVPPLTYREGDTMTNLVSGVAEWVLGWYTAEDGKGEQYYDKEGKPLMSTFKAQADVTLYAKIDPQYLPLGVYVNGRELDPMTEEGREGEGWSYDADNRLVTLSTADEYVLSGSNIISKVHFLVVNNATVVLSNLVLQTSLSSRSGLIEVARGAAVDMKLSGENSLVAQAEGIAGIFCPTGTTVKLWTDRKRDVSWMNPTNTSYLGVLTECEYAKKDLSVQGGVFAAAIGGRKATDGGVSGTITVQNCSIWASGGSGACDIGAGDWSLPAGGTNACGTVRFLGYPNVRPVVYVNDARPKVCPIPHGDWETPLFPRSVASRIAPGETFYNVFWFSYGTTRVKSTVYYSSSHVVTNEMSYTVTHTLR